MKLFYAMFCMALLFTACGTETVNEEVTEYSGMEVFEKNAATVAAYLADFQNESVDYDKYFAADYESWPTGYGDTDTTNLAQNKEWDMEMFPLFDFEIDGELNLLPGVDVETKQMDGSVRHYATWNITRAATDSTEAKTAMISMYQAYVFNEEGKIEMSLTYGDFGGMMNYLMGNDE